MLSLNYLKSILFVNGRPDIDGIENKNQVVEVRAGMGGAIKVLQKKDYNAYFVLEQPERHVFSLRNDGGWHECTQSIWIMELVSSAEQPEDVMERCLQRCERLFSIFVNRKDEDDKQLKGWIENNEMNAYARESGDYVGYEVFVNFRETKNMEYVPRG